MERKCTQRSGRAENNRKEDTENFIRKYRNLNDTGALGEGDTIQNCYARKAINISLLCL